VLSEIYDETELKQTCAEYTWTVQNIFGNSVLFCFFCTLVKYHCVMCTVSKWFYSAKVKCVWGCIGEQVGMEWSRLEVCH